MGTFQIPLLAAIDRVESAAPRSQPSARREFQLGGEGLNQAASPVDRADRCGPNDPSLSLSPRWGLEENKKEKGRGGKEGTFGREEGADVRICFPQWRSKPTAGRSKPSDHIWTDTPHPTFQRLVAFRILMGSHATVRHFLL